MVHQFNFINIREVLSRILRHPLLQDLNLEAAVQYTLDFLAIMGLPKYFLDKIVTLKTEDFRAALPCDLVSINQVRLHKNGIALRYMTGNFNGMNDERQDDRGEPTFKVQNRIIYTSYREVEIDISYKALPLDDEGFPLIPDNPIFLKALELYIKKEYFTVLFDMNKITIHVLNNTQQEYAFRAAQCESEFTFPSVSEMESIGNMLKQLIPRTNEFNKGFTHLGSKEYLRIQ